MKSSDQLLYKLLPHIEDVEKFKDFINLFSESKIEKFYQCIVENNFEEEKAQKQYSKVTFKNYKTVLKTLTIDYLIITKLKGIKAKDLRNILDIADLYTHLNIPLFNELDKELDKAIEQTDTDSFINLRTMFLGLKLQNANRLHINNYDKLIPLAENYLKTLTINNNNMLIHVVQLKVAVIFSSKSSIRTEKDAKEVESYHKELLKINESELTKSQWLYYLQTLIMLYLLKGEYLLAYHKQLLLLNKVLNITFPNPIMREYQLVEQINNAVLFGIKAKTNIDETIIFEKELNDEMEDDVVKSILGLMDLLRKKASNKITIVDIEKFVALKNKNEASMFDIHSSFIIATEYANIKTWKKALVHLKEMLSNAPSFKVMSSTQDVAILLQAICYYELFNSQMNQKNYQSFQYYTKYAYDKFRKNKEEYPLELIILKHLQKIDFLSTSDNKKRIFGLMIKKLENKMDIYAKIYWSNFCFYFNFNEWIENQL